jgi:tRNA U34 5-methylaminomethyl-2-thiouridine-forming methyltransferase MnmC
MKRLVHGRSKRVYLILDNLRAYHSKAVKKWLEENADKIAVFYPPSYSPELNPDELLNADLKQHVTKAAPARNKIALTRTAYALCAASRSNQRGSNATSDTTTYGMPLRSNASGPDQYDEETSICA